MNKNFAQLKKYTQELRINKKHKNKNFKIKNIYWGTMDNYTYRKHLLSGPCGHFFR